MDSIYLCVWEEYTNFHHVSKNRRIGVVIFSNRPGSLGGYGKRAPLLPQNTECKFCVSLSSYICKKLAGVTPIFFVWFSQFSLWSNRRKVSFVRENSVYRWSRSRKWGIFDHFSFVFVTSFVVFFSCFSISAEVGWTEITDFDHLIWFPAFHWLQKCIGSYVAAGIWSTKTAFPSD